MTVSSSSATPASWYRDSIAVELDPTPPLEGDVRTDVCVIGAGVTGCSTALHLAERGYRVVLLEALTVGHGASGRSGGQILPGLGTDIGTVEKALGRSAARDIWEMSREAVRLTADLVERHEIPCDLAWGYLHAAVKPRHVHELRQWQESMARDYDYTSMEWREGEELRQHVVTDAYPAALWESEGGHLHPLNYTLGLARAAQRAGVSLHQYSPVVDIDYSDPATVTTERGRVIADHVVLATNAYGDRLVPKMSGRIMRAANYMIATEPMSEAQASQVLPRNDALSDANFVLDYYRLSADRRLIYGGQVSYDGNPPRDLDQRIDGKIRRLFPVLDDIDIQYRWGGDVAITLNRAPDFGRLAPNIYYAQGYSGHGMALAGMAGKLLAETISGQSERFDIFAAMPHRTFPGGRWLRTPLLVLATTFYKLRDRL
ncbi:NAD(P)/FAD-dependent oxidoreductase [Halomonas huangheensis]|uniref:FAD-dependent oxidoreductase n=1 Tax=Halomonas huangheensis TaxID=1178482 RepID=W1NBZ0_9GAMM|nr:FAD-binding oxidoreductase [Halomonas huangheensis]ALM52995.1 FAD-dependent oxidoreductase [Halomonas huangheensis]ERL53077.1 FAD-dependent oxidoreductase [Halomonas huangheensis]